MRNTFLALIPSWLNNPATKIPWIHVIWLEDPYIWPSSRIFCFWKSNLTTVFSKLRSCTLCIIDAYENLSGNYVCFIAIDLSVFLMITEVLFLLIGTQLLILIILFEVINLLSAARSSNLTCVTETFSIIPRCFTASIWRSFSLSWTSRFTLDPNFYFKHLTGIWVFEILCF